MPKKVLIVDGDVSVRERIGAFLADNGYELGLAGDLEEAERQAEAEPYDIVIADIQWPDEQGGMVIPVLREKLPEATIIAISTFADLELEQEARRNGAYICLGKPLDEEDLLHVLTSLEAGTRARPETDFLPGKLIEQTLLRGFTPDQQWDFSKIGSVRIYQTGDIVQIDDEDNSMIWVERGRLSVYYNKVLVESLGEGEFWGEETFVNPHGVFTNLAVLEDSQLRHFKRKRIMDYFAYQEETLIKRYMINLIHCLHLKWKRTVVRLTLVSPAGTTQDL